MNSSRKSPPAEPPPAVASEAALYAPVERYALRQFAEAITALSAPESV